MFYEPLGLPETLSGNLRDQNYLHNNKMLFAFSTLILSLVYNGVLQSPYNLGCCNILMQKLM